MSGEHPRRYNSKPYSVFAVKLQTFGLYRTAYNLWESWMQKVMYVPQGVDHACRPKSHYDNSTGNVLDKAPPFLMVLTPDGFLPAWDGQYIVRDGDNLFVKTQEEMNEEFELEIK